MGLLDLGILVYGTAAGFALSGLVASGFSLLTGHRLRFAFTGTEGPLTGILAIFLRVAAGPMLLSRLALEWLLEEDANPMLVGFALVSAGVWAFLSGVVVVETIAGFAAPAAAGR
jgi:hypothetical protein